MPKKIKKKAATAEDSSTHLVEELEKQFNVLQKKLAKARGDYLPSRKAKVEAARKRLRAIQHDLVTARSVAARASVKARKSGTATARNELKKARAATLLLVQALDEAREVMLIAQSNLHKAKSFDRKLAARAKVLDRFKRDWEKKVQEEAAARAQQAKQAAARRRLIAKQRAEALTAQTNRTTRQQADRKTRVSTRSGPGQGKNSKARKTAKANKQK